MGKDVTENDIVPVPEQEVLVTEPQKDLSGGEPDERKKNHQNPLTHAGAHPEPRPDTNEVADRKATIVEPDGSDSPGRGGAR